MASVTELKCSDFPQYALREQLTLRERIVAETMRRLRCGLVTRRSHVPVERGWEGSDVTQVPKALIFEDEEEVEVVRRLFYGKTLPVWIEYFRSVSQGNEVYQQGNRMIQEIATSLELDEQFQEGGPDPSGCVPPDRTLALCNSFGMQRNAIVELAENRVLTIVIYQFSYFEAHAGADC